MPNDKTIDDFDDWVYGNDSVTFTVGFAHDKVRRLTCMNDSGANLSSCGMVAGVSIGDSEESVRHKLGRPTRHEYAGTSKTISYDDIGLDIGLEKGKVYLIAVGDRNRVESAIVRRFLGYGRTQ